MAGLGRALDLGQELGVVDRQLRRGREGGRLREPGLGVVAVPRVGSRLASFIGLSEVLFALAFAWLLLGEAPAPIQFAGGALILVGVVLVRLDAGAVAVSAPVEPLPAGVAPDSR